MNRYNISAALAPLCSTSGKRMPTGRTASAASFEMTEFNPKMTALRKEITGWIRYYTQLDDMVCEFQENENGYFSEGEFRMFHMAEIDVRQNRIMKILTIVTTIFLPLSLVAGWYGMNFVNMPELTWEYGYPAVIIVSALIVSLCLWIMKMKKFW